MLKKILILLFAFSALMVRAQKMYVVSVGIADYKEINDLQLTENDVSAFNRIMADYNSEITTILGNEATHANIIAELRNTFSQAKPEDTMIFFFSGHGYEGGFCCWDMSGSSPALSSTNNSRNVSQSQMNKANRYYGGLSYAEMQILFRNCRAKNKIVLADACFSGGLQKGNHINVSVQSARKGEVIYFLSSRPDEASLEMSHSTNGLFTYYLCNALNGEADANSDSYISIRELFDYVYGNVVEYANKMSHSQHPVMWGKFDDSINILKIKK